MTFKSILAASVLSFAVAGAAVAGSPVSDEVKAQASAALTALGYEVRSVQMEDGMIEAYAIKDGKAFEVYLDADMNIIEVKN